MIQTLTSISIFLSSENLSDCCIPSSVPTSITDPSDNNLFIEREDDRVDELSKTDIR